MCLEGCIRTPKYYIEGTCPQQLYTFFRCRHRYEVSGWSITSSCLGSYHRAVCGERSQRVQRQIERFSDHYIHFFSLQFCYIDNIASDHTILVLKWRGSPSQMDRARGESSCSEVAWRRAGNCLCKGNNYSVDETQHHKKFHN